MTFSPSPGPGWEALQQESQDSSTNNPSEDELDDADDDVDELSLARKRKGTHQGEPLVKRPRYTPPGPKRVENTEGAGHTSSSLFSRDGVNAVAGTSEDVQSERPKANNGTLVSGVSPTFFGQDIIPGINWNTQAGPSRLNMVPSNTAPALKIRSKDYVSSAKTRVKRKPKESARSPQPDTPFYPDLSKHSLSESATKGKRKGDNKLSEWGSKPGGWSETASAPVSKPKRSTQAPPKTAAPEDIIDLTSSPPPVMKPSSHEVIELSSSASDNSKEVEKPVLVRSSKARKDGQMARKRLPDIPQPKSKALPSLVDESNSKEIPNKPKPKPRPIAKVKPQVFELTDSDDDDAPARPNQSKRNGEVQLASTIKTSSASKAWTNPSSTSKRSSTSKASPTSDMSPTNKTPFSSKNPRTRDTPSTSSTSPIGQSSVPPPHSGISTSPARSLPPTRRESTSGMLSELVNECALESRNSPPTSATNSVQGDDNAMDVDQGIDVNMEPPPSSSASPPRLSPPAPSQSASTHLGRLHQGVVITRPLPLPTPAKVLDNQTASTSAPTFVQWPPPPIKPLLKHKPPVTGSLSLSAGSTSPASISASTPSRSGTSLNAKLTPLTSKTHRLSASVAFQKKIRSTPVNNATPAEPVSTEKSTPPSTIDDPTKTTASISSTSVGLSSSQKPAFPSPLQEEFQVFPSDIWRQRPAATPPTALPSSSQKPLTSPPVEATPSETMPNNPPPTASQKPPLPRKSMLSQLTLKKQAFQPIAAPSTAHSSLQPTSTLPETQLAPPPTSAAAAAMEQQSQSEDDDLAMRQVTPPPRQSDSVDMRPLDVALGIPIPPPPTSGTSRIKIQPISPTLPRNSARKGTGAPSASSSNPSNREWARKKRGLRRQSGQQTLADMIIEAGKNNTMSGLYENGKGNTKEEAIDLTADDDINPPPATKRRTAKPSEQVPLQDSSDHDLRGAIDQSKLVMQWIQNATAASKTPSSTPSAPDVAPRIPAVEVANERSRSTTDELALRPFQPLPEEEDVGQPQASRPDLPFVPLPADESPGEVSPLKAVRRHSLRNAVDETYESGAESSKGKMLASSKETGVVDLPSKSHTTSMPALFARHSFPGRSCIPYPRVTNIAASLQAEDSSIPPATPDLSNLTQPTSPSVPHRAVSLETLPARSKELLVGSSSRSEYPTSSTTIKGAIDGGISANSKGKQRALPEEQSDEEAEMEVDECQALLETHSESSEPEEVTSTLKGQELERSLPLEPLLLESGRTTPGSIPEFRRSSRRSSLGDHTGVDLETDDESSPFCRTPDDVPTPPEGKTYGGFPAITWKSFRQDPINLERKCYFATNLPHHLQDHINSMSERIRMHETMREILECTIMQNTTDEPDAPPIQVFNDIDGEPTPPWEFYYTNQMWHGNGVPPPDVTKLESCDCVGKCDPRSSKPCACLEKQRRYLQDPNGDFQYDKAGRLKESQSDYPIFECNDLCGCDEECRNRVVQRGRKVQVNIEKTRKKGWGVFAGTKKIPSGTFLGIYSGELLTNAEAEQRGKKYNLFGRTYLFDLDFYYLRGQEDKTWETQFVVDAYHAGNFTRFLNHSCDPNCRLTACYINESNIEKPLLTVFTLRDVEPHEEISFSYFGHRSDDEEDNDEDDNEDGEVSVPKSGAVYESCQCGAKNCKGDAFF